MPQSEEVTGDVQGLLRAGAAPTHKLGLQDSRWWWPRLIAARRPHPESVPARKDLPGPAEILCTEAVRSYELQGKKVRVTEEFKNFSEKTSMSQAKCRGERSWEKNWIMSYKQATT